MGARFLKLIAMIRQALPRSFRVKDFTPTTWAQARGNEQAVELRLRGGSFQKIVQRIFQLFECFFQAQHQRRHFLPIQVKRISVAEYMTESQVFIQRVVRFFRQQRRSVRGWRFHAQQTFTMPGIAAHRLAVQHHRHTLKNIFHAGVK